MESNYGFVLAYTLSVLILQVLPFVLLYFVLRRSKVSWWVILSGAVAYILSQLCIYPITKFVDNSLSKDALSISSATWFPLFYTLLPVFFVVLFQEGFRYFGFLIVRKKAKRVPSAVGFGIGFGGFESIALALWPFWPIYGGVLIQLLKIIYFNPAGLLNEGYSTIQVANAIAQINQLWAIPWHSGLLQGIEQIIILSTQILISVLVWKSVRRRNFGWFALAFIYHLLVYGISLYLQYLNWNYWAVNGILVVFVLANIFLVYYFWKEESEAYEETKGEKENVAEEVGEVDETDDEDDEDDDDEEEDDDYDDNEGEEDDEDDEDDEDESNDSDEDS